MNEQYSALRSNVSMLGKVLGETIKDALGEHILERVETIRKLSKSSRASDLHLWCYSRRFFNIHISYAYLNRREFNGVKYCYLFVCLSDFAAFDVTAFTWLYKRRRKAKPEHIRATAT